MKRILTLLTIVMSLAFVSNAQTKYFCIGAAKGIACCVKAQKQLRAKTRHQLGISPLRGQRLYRSNVMLRPRATKSKAANVLRVTPLSACKPMPLPISLPDSLSVSKPDSLAR